MAEYGCMPVRRMVPLRFAIATAALLAVSAGAARAEAIPEGWLDAIHDDCMRACTGAAPAATGACERTCTCITRQTAATMDKDDLILAEETLKQNQPLSPAIAGKAEAIKERCRPR